MQKKLQAMQSHCGGFQALARDSIVYSSSSSGNATVHLLHDVLPLSTQQTLYHAMGDGLLPFSSVSPTPFRRILNDDTALTDHNFLGNANAASQSMPSLEQEQRAQAEGETAIQSYANAQLQQYLYHGSVGDNTYSTLLRQVQQNQHQNNQRAAEKFLHIKNHLQVETYPSCTANDAQDSNDPRSFNRQANAGCIRNSCIAPLTASASSSSSSTPPAISNEQLTRLASKNLQAWMAYESNPFNGKEDAVMNINCNNIEKVQDQAKKKRSNPKQEQKRKRRRRRSISYKNVEEMETQRMTHIAVERNRRKQMNDHLRALRLLMPQSYIQRGDQASIVGATIRFVEELQQVLQSLRLQKHLRGCESENQKPRDAEQALEPEKLAVATDEAYADTQSCLTNVEVTMLASSTFFMKVEAQKSPRQLLHTLFALSSLSLRVTHLNVTTMGLINVFTFNLEADDGDFQLLTPLELAELVKHMLSVKSITKIREECLNQSAN